MKLESLTINKNQYKMDQKPKYKTVNYEYARRKCEKHFKMLVEVMNYSTRPSN